MHNHLPFNPSFNRNAQVGHRRAPARGGIDGLGLALGLGVGLAFGLMMMTMMVMMTA